MSMSTLPIIATTKIDGHHMKSLMPLRYDSGLAACPHTGIILVTQACYYGFHTEHLLSKEIQLLNLDCASKVATLKCLTEELLESK